MLCNRKILVRSQIQLEESWSIPDIAAEVSECAQSGQCKRALVEVVQEPVLLRAVAGDNRIANDVRPLPASAIRIYAGDIRAVREIHRLAAARRNERREFPPVRHV